MDLTTGEWQAPEITGEIPHGDMPGDVVHINGTHISKAQTIFPILLRLLKGFSGNRAVVSVYGGSGVGKSEVASVLCFYLNALGVQAYTMSGDNYPHRIPKYNDMERERVFREDGEQALRKYLGSELEINFKEVNEIIRLFHEGAKNICLRRMGRTETELWYDEVSFVDRSILILEWTHGNNDCLRGIDIPVFLASTPAETLAHRLERNRDGQADSPFVTKVLSLEQEKLDAQVKKAKIILSKSGEVLSPEQYLEKLHE